MAAFAAQEALATSVNSSSWVSWMKPSETRITDLRPRRDASDLRIRLSTSRVTRFRSCA